MYSHMNNYAEYADIFTVDNSKNQSDFKKK